MQFFSMTATAAGRRERTCAMVCAPTLDDAARQAEALRRSGHLDYVESGARYAVRPASRRETDLLQRFLNACNRSSSRVHMQSDFDGLLARRQTLLMSFFMGLYLAPEKVRKIAGASAGAASDPPAHAGAGSGGSASGLPSPTLPGPSGEASPPAGQGTLAPQEASPEPGPPIDDSSQNAALSAILATTAPFAGGAGGSTRDTTIDLGDDEFLP